MTSNLQETRAPANPLEAGTVLLVMRLGMLGNKRKVRTGVNGEVEVTPLDRDPGMPGGDMPDQNAITVAKELLDSLELKNIQAFQNEVRAYVRGRALPNYHMLKGSVHRLPVALVPEVDAHLLESTAMQNRLVEEFVNVLPQRMREARTRLGALFNPADYPGAEEARAAFRMQFRYLSTDVPAILGMISSGMMTRERAKAVAEVAAESDEIRLAMRQQFAELIQHATDRLSPDADGKKKTLRESVVTNLEGFFELFQQRNVLQDRELAALVERARQTMQGIKADDLRKGDTLRASIASAFNNIKAEMDRGLMLQPPRRIVMD